MFSRISCIWLFLHGYFVLTHPNILMYSCIWQLHVHDLSHHTTIYSCVSCVKNPYVDCLSWHYSILTYLKSLTLPRQFNSSRHVPMLPWVSCLWLVVDIPQYCYASHKFKNSCISSSIQRARCSHESNPCGWLNFVCPALLSSKISCIRLFLQRSTHWGQRQLNFFSNAFMVLLGSDGTHPNYKAMACWIDYFGPQGLADSTFHENPSLSTL